MLTWGPPLWAILHGLAEHVGKLTHPISAADEANEVFHLLKNLEFVLPCDTCRQHYRLWCKLRPYQGWALQGRRDQLREAFRNWLWQLHDNVNSRKEGVISLPMESLSEKYGNINISQQMQLFLKELKNPVWLTKVDPTKLAAFRRHCLTLQKLSGKI